MGFRMIFAGLLFFFNPCINLFDIFPDFIGCILISSGLYKLSDVEGRFFAARQISNRLIAIYLSKLFFWVYAAGSWKDGFLPLTFIYAVIEIIMMIGLCTSLYSGIEYVCNLHGGDKHLSQINTVSKYTVIFMIVKNALAFVPEAFELARPSQNDLSYHIDPVVTIADYKQYAVVFFTVIVLILGIYYIVVNHRFFKGLAGDRAFCDGLREIYDQNVTSNETLVISRRFRRFFIISTIAAFLTIDFAPDSVNILPDILCYALIFAAFLCLGGKRTAPVAVGIPLMLISVGTLVFRAITDAGVNRIMGYETYNVSRIRIVETGEAFVIGAALIVCEMILFVLLVALSSKRAAKLYNLSTGDSISAAFPTVCASLVAILSAMSYVCPYLKAYFHYGYINNTLTGGYLERMAQKVELIQGVSNLAVFFATLLFAYGIYHNSRKVNLRFNLHFNSNPV